MPGQRLVVRLLAEQFETSPMPVREALRRLVSEGALVDQANSGVIVPEATAESIADVMRSRCSIEGAVCEWAAATITAEELEAAIRLDTDMRDHAAHGLTADYLALNRQFHFLIDRAARSNAMLSIVERLWLRAGPWLNIMRGDATLGQGLDHHGELIDALRRGDGQRARRAVVADISEASDIMQRATFTPAQKGRSLTQKPAIARVS